MKLTVKQLINKITETSPLNTVALETGFSCTYGTVSDWNYAKLWTAKRAELETLFEGITKQENVLV